MTLFEGYTKTNKHVEILLEDDQIKVLYTATGRKIRWNDERYTEEDCDLIRFSLLNEGYRI